VRYFAAAPAAQQPKLANPNSGLPDRNSGRSEQTRFPAHTHSSLYLCQHKHQASEVQNYQQYRSRRQPVAQNSNTVISAVNQLPTYTQLERYKCTADTAELAKIAQNRVSGCTPTKYTIVLISILVHCRGARNRNTAYNSCQSCVGKFTGSSSYSQAVPPPRRRPARPGRPCWQQRCYCWRVAVAGRWVGVVTLHPCVVLWFIEPAGRGGGVHA
jgi:hypothetical protein